MKLSPLFLAALLALPASACVELEADPADDDIGVAYGPFVQGPFVQGPFVQGPFVQGTGLVDGILEIDQLAGSLRSASGARLVNPRLVGTELVATEHVLTRFGMVSVTRRGTDLIGATFSEDGVDYLIASARELSGEPSTMISPFANNAGKWKYVFAALLEDGSYDYICRPGSGDNPWGSLYTGEWGDDGQHIANSDVWSISCAVGAVHKCALQLGYDPNVSRTPPGKPWLKPIPMRSYHKACTVALTADLCGEKVSLTLEGTLISLEDNRGWNVPISQDDIDDLNEDLPESEQLALDDFTPESWYGYVDGRTRALAANWFRYLAYTEETMPPTTGSMTVEYGGEPLCTVNTSNGSDAPGWRIKVKSIRKEWDPFIPPTPEKKDFGPKPVLP